VNAKNYDLLTSAYKPAGTGSDTIHRDPKEIMKEIEKLDLELLEQKNKVTKMI